MPLRRSGLSGGHVERRLAGRQAFFWAGASEGSFDVGGHEMEPPTAREQFAGQQDAAGYPVRSDAEAFVLSLIVPIKQVGTPR